MKPLLITTIACKNLQHLIVVKICGICTKLHRSPVLPDYLHILQPLHRHVDALSTYVNLPCREDEAAGAMAMARVRKSNVIHHPSFGVVDRECNIFIVQAASCVWSDEQARSLACAESALCVCAP